MLGFSSIAWFKLPGAGQSKGFLSPRVSNYYHDDKEC